MVVGEIGGGTRWFGWMQNKEWLQNRGWLQNQGWMQNWGGGGYTDGKVSEMIVQLVFSPVLPSRVE